MRAEALNGPGEPERVRWTLDMVSARANLPGLRVLDLACRIGSFSAAFAARGAEVLGLDGRQENLDEVPPCSAKFARADVRELRASRQGEWDVTLCLGILYHLEAVDALALMRTMRDLTGKFAVIDTHVGTNYGEVVIDGQKYRGSVYGEALGHPWSALDNPTSWWFTEVSLEQALKDSGWINVEWIPGRSWPGESDDRRWLVVT